ncbi:MAG: hypothetical protein N3J91_08285 [Verrucomicrobiae bacterium]|nr:hypothetical protein [Verrucomicrobiae bacterium]
MRPRPFFLLVLAFWLVMNFLLFRAEYGGARQVGVAVAPQAVWHRIITAADSSSLEIVYQGQKYGVCRWMATVGEERPPQDLPNREAAPEGMVRRITGYTLDFDGNLMLRELGQNVRFFLRLHLSTNYTWRDLQLRTQLKPDVYEIHADAVAQRLTVRLSDGVNETTYAYTFDELRDPRRLLEDFEVPLPVVWLLNTIQPSDPAAASFRLGLEWQARHDVMSLGRSAMKVYRLQARVLDRYYLVVYVSRAGEILRVDFPGNVSLINYVLSGLQ